MDSCQQLVFDSSMKSHQLTAGQGHRVRTLGIPGKKMQDREKENHQGRRKEDNTNMRAVENPPCNNQGQMAPGSTSPSGSGVAGIKYF